MAKRKKRQPKKRPALTGWPWVRLVLRTLLLGTDFEVGALAGLLRNRVLGVVWTLAEAANAAQRGS